jgi:MSHA pilin protein MshD
MMLTTARKTSDVRTRGFTLVESAISVLIVSGVLVAALGTFGAIGKARQTQVDRAAAIHLAEQLLAEIMGCYYQEPGSAGTTLGPDDGETARSAFDDVDDYNNLQTSPPVMRDGAAMSDYAGWSRAVKVEYVSTSDASTVSATATGLKRIRVTVTTPGGKSYTVTGYRAAGGAYEQTPASTTNYLTFTGVSAQVGDRGKTINDGAHPLNITTSQ